MHSGFRKYIVIAGRRNVGKSSFINAFTGQKVAIVSPHAGTTTDPVYKTLEISPLGPVTLVDTPGLDDVGNLGKLRVEKAKKVFYRADLGLLIVDSEPTEYEDTIVKIFRDMEIPMLIIINKKDLLGKKAHELKKLYENRYKEKVIVISSKTKEGIEDLPKIFNEKIKSIDDEIPYLSDLIDGGDIVILVIPIDLGAPKGRLIMPQVHGIREVLDSEAMAVVVKERELRWALENLKRKPKLVVTDSQTITKVISDIPEDVNVTTFSILESRYRGDLEYFVKNLEYVEKLKDGDKVIIMEGCNHRPLTEDIGRVKIPRWLVNHTGANLKFEVLAGREFPDIKDLEDAKLIVHCGGCVLNRSSMMRRIRMAKRLGIPMVNYGVLITYLHGLIDRTIKVFGLTLEEVY